MSLEINHIPFGQLSDLADSLVIELSDSSIQCCELQSEQNKPLYVCYYPIDTTLNQSLNEHLINAIKHFQFSKKKYEHVNVNYFTHQFTLCPTAFFNSDNNRSMLEFNAGSVSNQLVLTDDINADIKLIYAIDRSEEHTSELQSL